ncbi:hypothetical protein ACHWQZ_G012801 [Mnemiopsis leidyi]
MSDPHSRLPGDLRLIVEKAVQHPSTPLGVELARTEDLKKVPSPLIETAHLLKPQLEVSLFPSTTTTTTFNYFVVLPTSTMAYTSDKDKRLNSINPCETLYSLTENLLTSYVNDPLPMDWWCPNQWWRLPSGGDCPVS